MAALSLSRTHRRRRSRLARREAAAGWLFASPWVIGFVAFTLGPMLYSLLLIFLKWDLITPPEWGGMANFERLLGDRRVPIALYNTAYYTFIGVPIHLAVAFLLALALNVQIRGLAIYRTIYYLPSITPAVANAVIWLQILQPDYGILNEFLRNFGIQGPNWLYEPALAKPAFILMSVWSIGPQMIIFLAGLQGVPSVLKEAATIDGAGEWSQFRHITVPIITPIIFFNLVVGIIGSFQVFTAAYIMTAGGPENSTLFYVLYLWRNGFEYFRMGYAALLAWVLFFIISFFTVIQFGLAGRWVYYETLRS
ncbi:MAG: carbohydrate ABC transporter permease [Anaerolineae bacterium]|jgi:multiple sugar transport system permease protein